MNGLEYRGFPIAIDFAREQNKLKRKADPIDNRSIKPFVPPVQQRFSAPVNQQRNTNPYNLPINPTNNANRSFENLMENNFVPRNSQPPTFNNGFHNQFHGNFEPRDGRSFYSMNEFHEYNDRPPMYSQDFYSRPSVSKKLRQENFTEDDNYDFNFTKTINNYMPDFYQDIYR